MSTQYQRAVLATLLSQGLGNISHNVFGWLACGYARKGRHFKLALTLRVVC